MGSTITFKVQLIGPDGNVVKNAEGVEQTFTKVVDKVLF